METAATIEGFSTVLASTGERSSLIDTLRAICAIDQPDEIRHYKAVKGQDVAPEPDASWGGWTY